MAAPFARALACKGKVWGLGGLASGRNEISAAIASDAYKSWVQLNPQFTPQTCDKGAIEAASVKFEHLPVEVSFGFMACLAAQFR